MGLQATKIGIHGCTTSNDHVFVEDYARSCVKMTVYSLLLIWHTDEQDPLQHPRTFASEEVEGEASKMV